MSLEANHDEDMSHPFSPEKLNTLEERLRKELAEMGGFIRYRVVWAREIGNELSVLNAKFSSGTSQS